MIRIYRSLEKPSSPLLKRLVLVCVFQTVLFSSSKQLMPVFVCQTLLVCLPDRLILVSVFQTGQSLFVSSRKVGACVFQKGWCLSVSSRQVDSCLCLSDWIVLVCFFQTGQCLCLPERLVLVYVFQTGQCLSESSEQVHACLCLPDRLVLACLLQCLPSVSSRHVGACLCLPQCSSSVSSRHIGACLSGRLFLVCTRAGKCLYESGMCNVYVCEFWCYFYNISCKSAVVQRSFLFLFMDTLAVGL